MNNKTPTVSRVSPSGVTRQGVDDAGAVDVGLRCANPTYGADWRPYKLNDLMTVKHGFAFKSKYFVEKPTSYQLVTPGNFAIGGGFQLGKGKYYAGQIPEDYILRKGDVVVTMTDLSRSADTLGYSALIPETEGTTWLHNQRVGLVKVKPEAPVHLGYLHYLMRSKEYRHWVVSSATGSTVKHTAPSRICDFQLLLPPIVEQEGIASVLEALDDRITLLRETNATLEAIAQALFKSWFVDFDPVHAKQQSRAPEGAAQGSASAARGRMPIAALDEATAALFPDSFEESELGLVPRGWKIIPLNRACEINPTRRISKGVVTPYLEMAAIPTQGHRTESPIPRAFSSGTKFINGDTLLARITPCLENGKTAFVDFLVEDEIGWGSTEYIVLRPKQPLSNYWAYLLCRHEPFRQYAIQAMVGTSGRQRVEVTRLSQYLVTIPDDPVCKAFAGIVEPLQRGIAANAESAKTLATLRDTLLPRLISGQLRLPEAETLIKETP